MQCDLPCILSLPPSLPLSASTRWCLFPLFLLHSLSRSYPSTKAFSHSSELSLFLLVFRSLFAHLLIPFFDRRFSYSIFLSSLYLFHLPFSSSLSLSSQLSLYLYSLFLLLILFFLCFFFFPFFYFFTSISSSLSLFSRLDLLLISLYQYLHSLFSTTSQSSSFSSSSSYLSRGLRGFLLAETETESGKGWFGYILSQPSRPHKREVQRRAWNFTCREVTHVLGLTSAVFPFPNRCYRRHELDRWSADCLSNFPFIERRRRWGREGDSI